MTIPESLGEALLVNGYESQTKSPDANAQGDFLYTFHVIAESRMAAKRSYITLMRLLWVPPSQ